MTQQKLKTKNRTQDCNHNGHKVYSTEYSAYIAAGVHGGQFIQKQRKCGHWINATIKHKKGRSR